MLAEVAFYVLATRSLAQRQIFACKLIEKAYRNGQFCYVLTEDDDQAEALNRLLWTFRAGSFVPHQRYTGIMPNYPNTVLIGGEDIPESWRKIIVNLSDKNAPIDVATERILEVIDDSETCKQAGRLRFRYYQQQGLAIETHKLQP